MVFSDGPCTFFPESHVNETSLIERGILRAWLTCAFKKYRPTNSDAMSKWGREVGIDYQAVILPFDLHAKRDWNKPCHPVKTWLKYIEIFFSFWWEKNIEYMNKFSSRWWNFKKDRSFSFDTVSLTSELAIPFNTRTEWEVTHQLGQLCVRCIGKVDNNCTMCEN